MNLIAHGAHAATDWVLVKLRAYHGPVEVRLLGDGYLHARRASRHGCRVGGEVLGVYRGGIAYRDLYADLDHARREALA